MLGVIRQKAQACKLSMERPVWEKHNHGSWPNPAQFPTVKWHSG